MLCYSPQIWASDDTDPVERLKIQGGLSYLYPLSTMGAHVSESPHQQTLRETPLPTRFNVAAFGCLGYELDLKYLTFVEKREIKSQIAFYKKHRWTLQFGRFYRLPALRGNKVHWQCMSGDGKSGVAGFFQTLSTASDGSDLLPLTALEPDARYTVATRPQFLQIKRFGGLIKHILPIPLNPGGFILRTANKFFCLMDCVERHEGHGDLLMAGIRLASQFSGTGYHAGIRMPGDFGSYLYVIGKQED